MAKIDSFSELKKNWDSYGAEPPNPKAIEYGKEVLRKIYEEVKIIPKHVEPTANGEIGLIYGKNLDIELEVMSNGAISLVLPVLKEYDDIQIDNALKIIKENPHLL